MKRWLLLTGVLVLGIGVLLAYGQNTIRRTTEVFNFVNGYQIGGVAVADQYGLKRAVVLATFCGENAENGTIYQGPIPLTTPQPAIDATACDTLTNATETSADARLFPAGSATLRPLHMSCVTNATLGSGESIVATLRANAADVPAAGADFACTIGEAATTCVEEDNGDTYLAATALLSMQVAQASNNADGDDLLCLVWFEVN